MKPPLPLQVLVTMVSLCASVLLVIPVHAQTEFDTIRIKICPGEVDCALVSAPDGYETYEWSTGDTSQTTELCSVGCHTYTLTDNSGDMLTGAVCLSDDPPPMIDLNLSFCSGAEEVAGWDFPPLPGVYADTVFDNITGCPDTIVIATLLEIPLNLAALNLYVCPEDLPPVTYIDTIAAAGTDECDTILTVTVTFGAFYPIQGDTIVCGDDAFPIIFRGVQFEREGIRTDTIWADSDSDCDTLIELEVATEPIIDPPAILQDGGTGTGSVLFSDTTLKYTWPDGYIGSSRTSLARGHYAVVVSDHSGCRKVYELYVPGPLDDNPVGTDEMPKIYPNPTRGDITIDFPADGLSQEHHVIVSDVYGRVVHSQACLGMSTVQIDLKGLPGVYILSIIRAGTYIAVQRIIRTQ